MVSVIDYYICIIIKSVNYKVDQIPEYPLDYLTLYNKLHNLLITVTILISFVILVSGIDKCMHIILALISLHIY